jgi:hypothetical protein
MPMPISILSIHQHPGNIASPPLPYQHAPCIFPPGRYCPPGQYFRSARSAGNPGFSPLPYHLTLAIPQHRSK